MFTPIDLYCERLGPGFWAEPVNALTNVFFLLAAWLAWYRARQLRAVSPAAGLLVGLLCAIGIGSFLFHTFATRWAELADVVPILLFQLTFVWLYSREVIGLNFSATTGILLAYFMASVFVGGFSYTLNGSLGYVPSLLVLLALGIYHALTRKKKRFMMAVAAGLFLASLIFRTLDNAVCPRCPLGVHFLWHICNAAMLYLVLSAWLANRGMRLHHASD
ncbi:MAG TPA: hypothetical protein ENN40_03365 [Candidatus Aminicenantes bacterium]|nr:hypothetical protein [Candidatus Aminicenantes bacterium]